MNSPDQERRRRIEAIFQELLDAAPAERDALLQSRCGDDAALRREVQTLIGHYESVPETMEAGLPPRPIREKLGGSPVGHDLPAPRAATDPEDVAGRRVGPYQLEREIGRGGMGRVFLATREDLPKRVAVKLVRESFASPERTQRFLFEQWVLAGLEHPAIAQLYDAGVADDGTPYFAMEYVDGEAIGTYCDHHRLSVDARLSLILEVVDAVRYCHAHLIIHRDIKPSNIVVTETGDPKLLDFGIAKLLKEDLESELTHSGLLVLSPAYAAPEQFGAEPATTATDVYQLGAVLYELLSGKTPFETEGKSLAEVSQIVRDTEPPPPSTRVTPDAAATRSTTTDKLRRKLRGDLDHLVAKALEKEPGRRYGSVAALASDLRRFLEDQPLEARAPTPIERASKFVLRHKLATGIAAALLLYAATATYGVLRISAERDRAQREAATATRVSDFMVGVFGAADPHATSAADATALQLVERGVTLAREELAGEPAVLAAMQEALGLVYYYLGHDDTAGELLRESLDTRLRLFGDDAVEVASSKLILAKVLWATGDFAGADSLVQESIEVQKREYGERSEGYLTGLNDLATIKQSQGDLAGAEQLLQELIQLERDAHPEGYAGTRGSLNNLANIYYAQGRFEEAELTMREALENDRQVLVEPHPKIALRLNNLAAMARRAGRHTEALELAEQALAGWEQVYPGPHPDIPYALTNIGNAALALGDTAHADSAHHAALAMRMELFDENHAGLVAGHQAYAEHLLRSGRRGEAQPHIERWRDLAARIYGEEHSLFGEALWALGLAHEALGELDAAEAALRRGLAILSAALDEDHPEVEERQTHFVEFLGRQGAPADAKGMEPAASSR